ncbi:COX15/CtaA family protein [Tessaracoccus lubricantis]|uniref:COX15/CtaA family protein n=1 Tax=Tessaracoccus lubricantis TaxID=545543 RepID=A0ABP9FIQ3_9ACTN
MDVLRKPFATERALRTWLWISLVCNMGIVVTGAVVRLTASGLGCSEWPRCTPDTWTTTPEAGIHGIIEFGNRLLTFVLAAAALGAFIAAWRNRGRFSTLWWLTLGIGIGIPFQGVIGGFTVWSRLNPFVVALHLLLSVALIVLCVWALVLGHRAEPTPVSRRQRWLVVVTFVATMVSIWLGTIVTGSGPHAGDASAPRTGFELELVARIHAASAWLVVGLSIACLAVFVRARLERPKGAARLLLVTVAAQGVIGYVQYFFGLPVLVVALHMVGLTLLTAAAAWLLFSTRSGVRRA